MNKNKNIFNGKKSIFSPYSFIGNIFKRPVTVAYPKEDLDVFPIKGCSPDYRGLHTNDLDKCIGCGTCEEICPTSAITMVEGGQEGPGRTGEKPKIDYGRCCFCAMCVDVCTSSSLKMSRDYLHSEPPPLFLDSESEIKELTDKFKIIPDDNHSNNIGFDTTDENSWLDLVRIKMGMEHESRFDSFIEIIKGFSKEQALKEASRCVECGVCKTNCPATMDIPEYIHAIWEDDLEKAGEILYKTNPLPGVCGRICTHKCEQVCSISLRGEAVSIRWLKRYIVDNLSYDKLQKLLLVNKNENKNKKIAVVGAGPSGLSAAYYLTIAGYDVTVYEETSAAGGVLRYGIPAYRLPDSAIDADIKHITELGAKIILNTKVGKDITYTELKEKFEAVYISIGLTVGKTLDKMPGADDKNVFSALDLLRKIRGKNGLKVIPESVTVIGGGNVAFDIGRSLARLQKKKYNNVNVNMSILEPTEKMLADLEEIEEGQEEGLKFFNSISPVKIERLDNKNLELECHKCISIFDDTGRFNPQLDDTQVKKFKSEWIVFSIGQVPDISFISEKDWGLIQGLGSRISVNEKKQTVVKGVFAGGDIVKGPDAITGIADGHKAALAIDEYLNSLDTK